MSRSASEREREKAARRQKREKHNLRPLIEEPQKKKEGKGT